MDPGWVTAALALASILVGLMAWGGRWAWRLGRRTWQFMNDWNGEPATPGHLGSPGVLERLSAVEGQLKHIIGEVSLDSGRSMKDVVNRTETAMTDLRSDMTDLADQVRNLPGGNP